MKRTKLKKILSLLLVICQMASFAGCVPGEAESSEPSTTETTSPTESTTAPTDATTSTAEETQAPTTPTEAETQPPATEAPFTEPTFATELPTESPEEIFSEVDETVYAIANVNVRSGPSTDDSIIGSLRYGDSVQRTGIGNRGWSGVVYGGEVAYVSSSYLSTTNPAQDLSGIPRSTAMTPAPLRSPKSGTKTPGATSPTSSSPTTPGSAPPAPTASTTTAMATVLRAVMQNTTQGRENPCSPQ